jgi:hypothetical protein
LAATVVAAGLFGCGSGGDGYGVAKDPNVVPPKPFDQQTKEEKLRSIDRLPIPDAEKVKMRKELDKTP